MKVNKYYSYSEAYSGNKIINFGLVEVNKFSLSEEETVIIINTNENNSLSAIKKSDCFLYFKASTNYSPKEFIKIWSDDLDILEEDQKNENPNYKEGQSKYFLDLAKLIAQNKPFSFEGIKFKII